MRLCAEVHQSHAVSKAAEEGKKKRAPAPGAGKTEGDGMQLTPLQSMGSGFSAACIGPVATGPFDVVKVRAALCRCRSPLSKHAHLMYDGSSRAAHRVMIAGQAS